MLNVVAVERVINSRETGAGAGNRAVDCGSSHNQFASRGSGANTGIRQRPIAGVADTLVERAVWIQTTVL